MIKYVVENTTEESVTVDGLGVLLPKESLDVGPEVADEFAFVRGLKLTQVHLPVGVELSVAVDTNEGE
jgi:hypothetical protein